MTATIVWGVIWLAIGVFAIPALAITGAALGAGFDKGGDYGASRPLAGYALGWLVGIIIAVFAFIQVILHGIHLYQLVVG